MATEGRYLDQSVSASAFHLLGTDGERYALEAVRGEQGLVVVFMCNHCPYVQTIVPLMGATYHALKALDIGMVGINSNDSATYPEDSYPAMVEFVKEHNIPFPYLYDEDQSIAKAYKAVCTPEFYGFDANMNLRYRGRMAEGGMRTNANSPNELLMAMKQMLTGANAIDAKPALGCSIKWAKSNLS